MWTPEYYLAFIFCCVLRNMWILNPEELNSAEFTRVHYTQVLNTHWVCNFNLAVNGQSNGQKKQHQFEVGSFFQVLDHRKWEPNVTKTYKYKFTRAKPKMCKVVNALQPSEPQLLVKGSPFVHDIKIWRVVYITFFHLNAHFLFKK